VVDKLERGYLLSSLLDSLSYLRVCNSSVMSLGPCRSCRTQAVLHVDRRSSALEDTESAHNGWGHAVLGLVDLEVLEGALGLGSPVLVRRDLNFAKGIALGSGVGHSAGEAELAGLEEGLCLQREAPGRLAVYGG
jgi:hypothetical protein